MAPKGRKRAAEALKVEIDASYMMMARASGESRYKASRDFNEVADRETPYGRILKYMDLQGDDDLLFYPGVRLPVRVVLLPLLTASYVSGTCNRVVGVLHG